MDNFMDRVHPELKEALEMTLQMPRIDLNDIQAIRDNPRSMLVPEINLPGIETITTETCFVPGPDGAPAVAWWLDAKTSAGHGSFWLTCFWRTSNVRVPPNGGRPVTMW